MLIKWVKSVNKSAEKVQKVQIKSANEITLWDTLGLYLHTLQLSFAIPLNDQYIFYVLLRGTSPFLECSGSSEPRKCAPHPM